MELTLSDYSLTGKNSRVAVEKGLAEAHWYTSPVPREKMRELLTRRNGPAIRDTIIWFALITLSGTAGFFLWGTWWAILPFLVYGVLYASTSDSRWHETSHGTAFKTDWMNNVLYEIASFMVMRESTYWRWSHTRHHSDTIIVGRDPEIAVPRPADLRAFVLNFFNVGAAKSYFSKIFRHAFGRLSADEKTFIPLEAYDSIFWKARIHLGIYLAVIAAALATRSFLPLVFIGLPNFYGSWLMPIYGYTQHAGLAENVLDHRLNCRTVYMNLVNRFLYWNMNYHVEHHMFPLVPYHALPELHRIVKDDMPPPYPSILVAFREIIPAVLRQAKDPGYYIRRVLPAPRKDTTHSHARVDGKSRTPVNGWIEVCPASQLGKGDILRFDFEKKTYALYRTESGECFATEGFCTHGTAHLADGFLRGNQIECPKHNGRFDVTDGSPKRAPVCVALKTYGVRIENEALFLNLTPKGGASVETSYSFRVVSCENVATFIKELVLEPAPGSPEFKFSSGEYLQLEIPAYGTIEFKNFDIRKPFADVWKVQHVFDYKAVNEAPVRRNYSMASNPAVDKQLRFNVRIATPPRGQDCEAGSGSSFVFQLKPGDMVKAYGPFGDFHIKPGEKEMVYLGGGAGMAPLRSHLSYLFETLKTKRKVSFWYGARSLQEVFYRDYFEKLAREFPNFSFHLALSEPEPGDGWTSLTGFIHEVLKKEHLEKHPDPTAIEYYLCGPPPMMSAARKLLDTFKVSTSQIAYDEF